MNKRYMTRDEDMIVKKRHVKKTCEHKPETREDAKVVASLVVDVQWAFIG